MKWIAIVLLCIAAAIGALGASDLIYPPFSDAEIQESFVDTWEVAAIVTHACLVLLGLVALICIALAVWTSKVLTRRLAIAAIVVSLASGALSIYNHVVLTERTAKLTGQTFGGFYGIF